MNIKKARHQSILKIISEHKISTQEELVAVLKNDGFEVTQATISRDIRELGIGKTGSEGEFVFYSAQNQSKDFNLQRLITVFSQSVYSYDTAANLVVIKTYPGMAPGCASAVDSISFEEVVGTIAGDDTIFIATRSNYDAVNLTEKIKKIT